MEDCLFCKIVKGEIPSTKVYEDESVLAFKDINPAATIHILIIPKKHISCMNDIKNEDKDLIFNIHLAIQKIAEEQGFKENGYRIIVNCGKDAGQEVMHLHYHILAGEKAWLCCWMQARWRGFWWPIRERTSWCPFMCGRRASIGGWDAGPFPGPWKRCWTKRGPCG